MDIVFFLFLFFKSNKFWSNIYITLNVNSDVRIFFFFFCCRSSCVNVIFVTHPTDDRGKTH